MFKTNDFIEATIENTTNFEYKLGIEAKDIGDYDTKSVCLKDLVLNFKKNKKFVSVGIPLKEHRTINNHIYLMLMGISLPAEIIYRADFQFFVGYHELKYLYRFMYKNEPIIRDGYAYYYKNFSPTFKEKFENSFIKVKIYNNSTNINSFIRRYYDYNCSFK